MTCGLIAHILPLTDDLVEFCVQSVNNDNEFIYVQSRIPASALTLLEVGNAIHWDLTHIYVQIFDVYDNKFEKIGHSYGWHFI